MRFEVIHRDQGQITRERDGFGDVHPHHQGSRQSWTVRNGDRVDSPPIECTLIQGSLHDRHNGRHLTPGSQFRHYASMALV